MVEDSSRTREELIDEVEHLRRRCAALEGRLFTFFPLAEESGEIFWTGDSESAAITYISPAIEKAWGLSRSDVYQNIHTLFERIHGDDRERIYKKYGAFIEGRGRFNEEFRIQRPDGSQRWIWARAFMAGTDANSRGLVEGLALDITAHKKNEEKLKASLHEKEILLREIHHRVKNNLQVVSSLLNLQSSYVQDERLRALIRASRNRVRSMALVHEKLYHAIDASHIDFSEYLRTIASYLIRSFSRKDISFTIEAGKIRFGLDTAIPCGLIVNELISNALEHAFPEGRSGTIFIQLRTCGGGTFLLTISDNGIGLPPGLDISHAETLGFQIFNDLVRQLDGSAEISRDGGTRFIIRFRARVMEVEEKRVPFY